MIRAAGLTCTLLALAAARVYPRCELARDLRDLGVHRDHISTWVCIAYHESRFDTAANNPHSGDHGLFQISELYWCGPGKACGLPCSALRDEDISDDLECALRVHEEHTRLQGDGFLAWVVYPQHCKHNTKKYIVDCDSHLKEGTVRSRMRSRTLNSRVRNATFENNPNIDNLVPPYLAINSITRGGFGKVLDGNSYQKGSYSPQNWLNFKIDNIDELTLPVFGGESVNQVAPSFTSPQTTTTTTSAPTTTSSTYPPVKVWRRIESDQFRKKIKTDDNKSTTTKWLELGKSTQPDSAFSPYKTSRYYDWTRTTTASSQPEASTTTQRSTISTTITKLSTEASTKAKPRSEAATTALTDRIQTTTPLPFYSTTSSKPWTVAGSTKTSYQSSPYKAFSYISQTAENSLALKSSTQTTPTRITTKVPVYERVSNAKSLSTTSKPLYESITKVPAISNTPITFTSRTVTYNPPSSVLNTHTSQLTTSKQITTTTPKYRFGFFQSSFTTPNASTTTTEAPGFRAFKSFRTSRVLTQNATSTSTMNNNSFYPLKTNRPVTTIRPFPTVRPSSTKRPLQSSAITTVPPQAYTQTTKTSAPTIKSMATTKSWQSVFDLYLKPTQRPPIRTHIFPELSKSAFRLKIFSSGTTTPVPVSSDSGNASKKTS